MEEEDGDDLNAKPWSQSVSHSVSECGQPVCVVSCQSGLFFFLYKADGSCAKVLFPVAINKT